MTLQPDVLLIPGLFSPRWMMYGLKRALAKHGATAAVWDDASVFGDLELSIERLRRKLDVTGSGQQLQVVTHSFGDWLFRQACARGATQSVNALVSLAPVMKASIAARLFRPLSALSPEISVMASNQLASAHMQTPPHIDRLIIWAQFDLWVSRARVADVANTRETEVTGLHNSLVWQPRVHRLMLDHLLGDQKSQ